MLEIELPSPGICVHELCDMQREAYPFHLFGSDFKRRVVPEVIRAATSLACACGDVSWRFFALSNGGFLMAPSLPDDALISLTNAGSSFGRQLSGFAFGVVSCLRAYGCLAAAELGGLGKVAAIQRSRLAELRPVAA